MNVLLTGGTGYIGSHTAVALHKAGHRVVLYDNLSNSNPRVAERLERITGQRLPFIEGDVLDAERLCHALQTHQINAVIHFAGLKSVGESLEKPIDYYVNNVQGTISLLQAMRASNVKTLVFSSSATVYGEPQYLPLDEAHPTSAANPYGRCKLHSEAILRDVVNSDPCWRIACLRYFNPVGAHESGLIGECPIGISSNLMPFIAQVASGERQELRIFGNDYPTPDGTGVRDYVHVMDLAEGHALVLDYLVDRPGWYVSNLGTGKGHSVLEMVRAFAEASRRPIPYKISPRRAGDVAECYASPAKAARELHWVAKRDLASMCASTWHYLTQIEPSIRS